MSIHKLNNDVWNSIRGKVLVYGDNPGISQVIDLLDENKTCDMYGNTSGNSLGGAFGGKIGTDFIYCGGKEITSSTFMKKCYQVGLESPIGNLVEYRRWAGSVPLSNDTLFVSGMYVYQIKLLKFLDRHECFESLKTS